MRILIISPDQSYAKKLLMALCQANYAVDVVDSADHNRFWSRSSEYDLMVIENSEVLNVINIAKSLRDKGRTIPLLVITSSLSSQEARELFNNGVDDYLSKFNSCGEVVLRVRSLLRRGPKFYNETIKIDDLILDSSSYTVARGKRKVHLTKKEFGLLEYLLRNQNQVLSRTSLIEHVWDINADLFSNSLETHILNLRKKIEAPNKPKLIHTISGRGYKIAMEQ